MAETRLCKLYKRNVLHNSQKEREREEEKNLLPSTISIKLRFKTQTLLPEYGKQINKAFSSLRQELKISLVQSSDSFWEEQITAGITSFRNIFLVMTKNCFLPVKCKSPRGSLGFFFFFSCVSRNAWTWVRDLTRGKDVAFFKHREFARFHSMKMNSDSADVLMHVVDIITGPLHCYMYTDE